ncbi:hypothetical protein GMMP15_680006 [Candidatus Magnetomoraceae bacterium gMMP-15]
MGALAGTGSLKVAQMGLLMFQQAWNLEKGIIAAQNSNKKCLRNKN